MKTKGIESGAPRPSQLSGQPIEAQKPAKQSPADLPSGAVIPFGGRDLFRFDGGDTIQPQLPEAPPPALVGTRRWIDATSGVGLDCAEGMPLLNGHRPSSWSEGAEAFYRLSKAAARSKVTPSCGDGAAALGAIGTSARAALLKTINRIVVGSAFDGLVTDELSSGAQAQLRASVASVLGSMSESLLTDETRAGRDQLRSALTLLAKLTAGESNTHIKEAMVGALYRLRDDLPAELRAVVDPAVADYVPVWGFESDPEGAGGLQPVHISHFDLDADGRVIGLSGPRVKIVMPEEIIVKLDDMTFKPTETVPSPLPTDVQARQDGAFVFAPSDPLTGATTAFYAASKVIEAADRWAGRTVGWGKNGQITVIPYKFVTHFFNAYFDGRDKTLNLGSLGNVDAEKGIVPYSGEVPGWEIKVENLLIDASRSRDIVAHEAGHAVLDALKPGMRYGMGMAFNEGFSDVVAFLTAFDDPDVVARVLEETGGDLSKSNEASRVAEVVGAAVSRYKNDDTSDDDQRYMRSVRSELTMKDTGLAADARDIPGMGFSPSRSPHRIGEIVSGMAYDLFVALYDQWVAAGETPEVAIATAKETVGALIVRAMPYVGEHSLSMRQLALAMLRVDGETNGKINDVLLRAVFDKRGMLPADFDVAAATAEHAKGIPEFVLLPSVTKASEIMAQLERFESAQVEVALAAGDDVDKSKILMLRHNGHVPTYEQIKPDDLKLFADVTDADGLRVIRLVHHDLTESMQPGAEPTETNRYLSLVFDASGKLVDAHVDRPLVSMF